MNVLRLNFELMTLMWYMF